MNAGKPLREGFTTGSAAAAAAFAAVSLLLGGALPETVRTPLPPIAANGAAERFLPIPIEKGERQQMSAYASVIKDGGDDPDATHGARLVAHASFIPFADGPSDGAHPSETQTTPPVLVTFLEQTVVLYGGEGIGRVTLPGLPLAVGETAINPEPRRQIAAAVIMAATALGHRETLHVRISVPDGAHRARHTLNARLGILGGISILGTQGIVRPYSHDAWKATIRQGLDVAKALGLDAVLFSTGRRSERWGLALHPELPAQAAVQAADYAAFSLREAAARSFSRILWVCMPGKLLKLAQGLAWTHARSAPADMALLARCCREAGGPERLDAALRQSPTASGALALVEEESIPLRDAVLRQLAGKALAVMGQWLQKSRAGQTAACPALLLHVFSPTGTPLLACSLEECAIANGTMLCKNFPAHPCLECAAQCPPLSGKL